MGLQSHTGQSWSLRSTLGRASHLSDRRLLFCETGKAVSLAVEQLEEMMHVTNQPAQGCLAVQMLVQHPSPHRRPSVGESLSPHLVPST